MYTTDILSRMTDIREAEWNPLTAGGSTLTYGWVKTVEETSRAAVAPRYVLVRSGSTLVGAAPCAVSFSCEEVYTLDHSLLGRLGPRVSKLGLSFLPALICPHPRSDAKRFLLHPSLSADERAAVARELLDGIEAEARRRKLSTAFLGVHGEEPELYDLLNSRGYNRTVAPPECHVDVTWSSFDDYAKALGRTVSRKMPRVVRREVKENRKAGVSIRRLQTWSDCEARIYELLNENYLAHNGLPFAYRPDFFRRLHENCGTGAEVYTAHKEGAIIGASLAIRGDGVIGMPSVGVDHARSDRDFTYFNLAYYRPIADAIDEGIQRIYVGNAVYEAKVRRGCTLRPVSTFHKSASRLRQWALRPWFYVHARWWRRVKFSEYLRRQLAGRTA